MGAAQAERGLSRIGFVTEPDAAAVPPVPGAVAVAVPATPVATVPGRPNCG